MRVVIQRVSQASVKIDDKLHASIGLGFLILVGIEEADGKEDIEWLTNKILNLRIFNDENGKMNLSLNDSSGELLIISQFTLFASTKKGNRPSFTKSAIPSIAIPLYQQFVVALQNQLSTNVKTGVFGANMQVELINDGPVTILIDSKNRC